MPDRSGFDEGIGLADLRTGEVTRWVPALGAGARVTSLAWRPGSTEHDVGRPVRWLPGQRCHRRHSAVRDPRHPRRLRHRRSALPDLTGDPDQQLTHDFSTAPPSVDRDRWDPPYALAGLLALLSGFVLVGLSLRRP